jgi:hypothetical protein
VENIMKAQTSGIVIALASTAVGGLFPAAIAALSAGTYDMAAGLGIVALMNAIVAIVHIGVPSMSDRAARNAVAGRNQTGNVENKPAHRTNNTSAEQPQPKEPLNFPVLGWYSLPEEAEDLPPEVAAKKPAKSRA